MLDSISESSKILLEEEDKLLANSIGLIVSKSNLEKADLIRLGQVWLVLFLLIRLFIYLNPGLKLAIEKKLANPSLRLK